ncbi:MAG: CopG family transcriptional regulator [Candidatus Aenigmarchaeota archaeon]|nr:CopG family transcriptional regulator [Candidatus Aenigmarchaeota archaeon]
MRKRKYTSVSIPVELVDKIKKEIKNTGFKSVSDYVIFIIREVLSLKKKNKVLLKEDEKKIKEKLKALGYWE